MFRNIIFIALAIIVALASAMFANKNPGTIELDLIVRKYEVATALAFTFAVIIGWIFGIATASLFLLKSANEKRKLKKNIKLAEVELQNLRSLPMQDAG